MGSNTLTNIYGTTNHAASQFLIYRTRQAVTINRHWHKRLFRHVNLPFETVYTLNKNFAL
jgi:hypothetical protein